MIPLSTLIPICVTVLGSITALLTLIFKIRSFDRELAQKQLSFDQDLKQRQEDLKRRQLEFDNSLAEDRRKYSLEVLRQAFLDDRNTLVGRKDALQQYRKLGGDNYIGWEERLENLPES